MIHVLHSGTRASHPGPSSAYASCTLGSVPFRKHLRAAATHERAAQLHERAARFWDDANDHERSEREATLALEERERAGLEQSRARDAGYVSN